MSGSFDDADDQGQRPDRLVVGGVDELRRRPALDDHQPGAAEGKAPGLQVRQAHLLRQALADLLQRLARVAARRHIDQRAVAGADEQLEIAGGIVEPERCRRLPSRRWLLAADGPRQPACRRRHRRRRRRAPGRTARPRAAARSTSAAGRGACGAAPCRRCNGDDLARPLRGAASRRAPRRSAARAPARA